MVEKSAVSMVALMVAMMAVWRVALMDGSMAASMAVSSENYSAA